MMKPECAAVFPAYLQFQAEIERYILKKVKSKVIAEDLTSQLSLKMYHHCEKLAEVQNVRAWLYRVASNVVNDYFRLQQKEALSNLTADFIEAEETGSGVNEAVENCLLTLLSRLPAHYQEAVKMADMEGIPQKEIAEKLGLSYSAVKMRVQRGRELLKNNFNACCSETVNN